VFEHRTAPLLTRRLFYHRLAASIAIGFAIVLFSLAWGMIGYRMLEGLRWIDAFVNAAMLLSGMGPLHDPSTDAGKIFAGIYALYSGFIVLIAAAVAFAPVFHRFLHRFHLEQGRD
jgi:vacuolar-type H+-ATPase subunit I/STV1